MGNVKDIAIVFSKGSVLTGVSAQCAALARTIELSSLSGKAEEAESVRQLAGYINSPSDNVVRPIVARAFTEAFDQIKSVCQRYLVLGRVEDDNRLESIIEGEVNTVYNDVPATQGQSLGNMTPEAGIKYKISAEGLSSGYNVILNYNNTNYTLSANAPTCEVVGAHDAGAADFRYEGSGAAPNAIVITADSTAFVELTLELGMPTNFNIGVTSTIKSMAHKILVDYILSQVLRFQRPNDSAALLKDVEWSKEQLLRALSARNTFTRSHHDWE